MTTIHAPAGRMYGLPPLDEHGAALLKSLSARRHEMSLYRKSYEVVGWTFDGSAYCTEHAPDDHMHDRNPVFLSDVQPGDLTCDATMIDGRPCGADLTEV